MKKTRSFLGQGWAFPPAFLRDLNSVVMSAEEVNIQENLHILFSTQQGERIMKEDYGTALRSFIFSDPDGDLYPAIKESIENAILLYEPRINLLEVLVAADPSDPHTILITVQYAVRTNNSRRNFVYPFHIIEGTNLE
jgi:phage baseplate assembly protein W